jgi:integrase
MAARRSREEEQRLIACAYRMQGARGLLIDTLFQASARVSEFVSIKAENGFLDEQMILTAKAKGGKSRYVPMRASLAHELRTYRGERTTGDLFETNRNTRYSPCLFQQILKETIEGQDRRIPPAPYGPKPACGRRHRYSRASTASGGRQTDRLRRAIWNRLAFHSHLQLQVNWLAHLSQLKLHLVRKIGFIHVVWIAIF